MYSEDLKLSIIYQGYNFEIKQLLSCAPIGSATSIVSLDMLSIAFVQAERTFNHSESTTNWQTDKQHQVKCLKWNRQPQLETSFRCTKDWVEALSSSHFYIQSIEFFVY